MSSDSSNDGPREGKDPLGLDQPESEDSGTPPPATLPPPGRRGAAPADPARPAPGDAEAVAARGGGILAALALLLALAAAGGAGYLYYELIYRGDVRSAARQINTMAADVEALNQRLQQRVDGLAERQQAELDAFRESQRGEREKTERALRESLAEVARQAPPATSEWQRAEAQYLLRVANYRLLMEHDVEGTLRLLHAADGVLAELDDFSLHEVRARLADEIAALQAVQGTDLQGLFLRLEAAKRELDRLPLREPRYLTEQPAPAPQGEGFWAALRQQVAGLLRFRRLDAEQKPLLAPEESVYLELNLRLMLERAQLAALRRDQMVFEQSLDTAIDWIEDYLNTGEAPARSLLDELVSLRGVKLEQPLPDISGSLNALQQVLRNPE